MPRTSKVYVIGHEAFVPHPLATGLWIRTHLSVVKVACPYELCKSAVGVPCRRTSAAALRETEASYGGQTHWHRRRAARGLGRDWRNLRIIVENVSAT